MLHFALRKPVFIGKNQKGRIPGRLGEQTLPQLTLLGRVSVALVWPGGHTQLVGAPGLVNSPYLLLVFLFLLQTLTKQPLIVWLQPLDSGRILLNLLICQDFALIPLFRIYSELNQNLVGFWACFSFLSFSTWAYI